MEHDQSTTPSDDSWFGRFALSSLTILLAANTILGLVGALSCGFAGYLMAIVVITGIGGIPCLIIGTLVAAASTSSLAFWNEWKGAFGLAAGAFVVVGIIAALMSTGTVCPL